jgi:hypothetical protein
MLKQEALNELSGEVTPEPIPSKLPVGRATPDASLAPCNLFNDLMVLTIPGLTIGVNHPKLLDPLHRKIWD